MEFPRDVQGNEIRAGDRVAVATRSPLGGDPTLVIRCVRSVTPDLVTFTSSVQGPGLLLVEDAPRRALRLS